MTEQEWAACGDPKPMLEAVRGRATTRQLRLFAVACCGRIINLFQEPTCLSALDLAGRFADGNATPEEMSRTLATMERLWMAYDSGVPAAIAESNSAGGDDEIDSKGVQVWIEAAVATAAYSVVHHKPQTAAEGAAYATAYAVAFTRGNFSEFDREERADQARLLRAIIGNPFHPPPPLPEGVLAWNDATIRRIAEGIYEERAFERLPILADALIDAGCQDDELIGHSRSEEPHLRGCWGVDLILGRS